MGLLSSKPTCVVCGNPCGSLIRKQLADNSYVCNLCSLKAGFNFSSNLNTLTSEEVVFQYQRQQNFNNAFTQTRGVKGKLEIDENAKLWKIQQNTIRPFSEIISFELLEDEESITEGGLGRAVAGGVLLGGVGAVVGGTTGKKKTKSICTSLRIKITLNSKYATMEYIDFLSSKTKHNSIIYKNAYNQAQECLSLLQLICNNQQQSTPSPQEATPVSDADEILKYKNLLDMGAITQEEYDAKKRQILNI